MSPKKGAIHTLLVTSLARVAIAGSLVDPYPVNDCSGGVVFGGVTCPNQPGCCSGGAVCCAGGCCPMTAWCVGMGTPDEGCCPFGDSTNCGVAVPSYTLPACDGNPKPSVQCVSADDDWYCPPGHVCGTYSGACFDFAADCTTPGADTGNSGPTPTTAPPSPDAPQGTDTTSSPGGAPTASGGGGGNQQPANNAGVGMIMTPGDVYRRLGAAVGGLVVVGFVGFVL